MLRDRLATATSGLAFVADTLRWAIEEALGDSDPRGCLVMNIATEFAQRDPQIASVVSDGLATYRAISETAVRQGQNEGSVRADKSADVLSSCLMTTMSGLRTMVKAGTDLASISEMVTVAMDALEP